MAYPRLYFGVVGAAGAVCVGLAAQHCPADLLESKARCLDRAFDWRTEIFRYILPPLLLAITVYTMAVASVSRLTVEKLLAKGNIPSFALTPAWLDSNKWRVFIPCDNDDVRQTVQSVLGIHESVIVDSFDVFKTEREDKCLHEVIFFFTSIPKEPK